MESARFVDGYSPMPKTWSSDFCITRKFMRWGIKHEVDTLLFGSSLCAIANVVTSGLDLVGNMSLTVLTSGELMMYPAYIVWRDFIINLPTDTKSIMENDQKAHQISVHVWRMFATIPQATAGTFIVMFYGLQAGLNFATKIELAPADPIVIKTGETHPLASVTNFPVTKLVSQGKFDEARKLIQKESEQAQKEARRWMPLPQSSKD